MKVLTILGTRPEIIRLSLVINKLDQLCDHCLVHTGQNFDPKLSDIFFQELNVRKPDHYLQVEGKDFSEQVSKIIMLSGKVLAEENPDRILILGDTNSALSSIVAKRLGIPVFHMEAGNRCYDDRVPEEVNRRIIDHCSDIWMPYTERSRQNLLREGIPGDRIFVIGNPINEVIQHFDSKIQESEILKTLGLNPKEYFLVTMHRAENVDIQERLHQLTLTLDRLQKKYHLPIIVSTHPHTRKRMELLDIDLKNEKIHFSQPFGFYDFITLERNAKLVISDSGTVQEECSIMKVANVTIRDVTERPETIECGSNILSGANSDMILNCVNTVLNQEANWDAPIEYLENNVSTKVIKIVTGYIR